MNFAKQISNTNTVMTPNPESKNTKTTIDDGIKLATSSIRSLLKHYSAGTDCISDIKCIQEALDRVDFVAKSVLIPRENVLRDFFECILGLDPIVESTVDLAIDSNTTESWVVLCTFFRLLQQLALVSVYWKNKVNNLFGEDLMILICKCNSPTLIEKEEIRVKLKEKKTLFKPYGTQL
eukprot:CAMPEP_0197181264 /NCGR_PEP_ID=MMETSP1423-20130617/5604_1 /TAXON_ID=476441 /ORGANISM="Pseudo-nitzschia heimii, Strain UNC1101" /LENGTH=178 /DNA_ID=CAMNT_0042631487 /DNA_START=5 /DNA_END=541 /DNA_ORIENTATION=-